jgi:hypothetical protein
MTEKKLLDMVQVPRVMFYYKFCGITSKQIPFIAEVNQEKFGSFTPGTLIPIISEEEAKKMNPDYFLVLPWHFKDSILEREKEYIANGGNLFFHCLKLKSFSFNYMSNVSSINKAVIVGSNGQDGKLLSNYLKKKHYLIIELNKNNFDISNYQSVEKLIKSEMPNEVYFLAAFHHSSEDLLIAEHDLFNKSFEINTLALINFLESIKNHSKQSKLFYASSSLVLSLMK